MMRAARATALGLAGLLAGLPARALVFDSSSRGTTTAGFLKLAVGARPVAMGEAYTAVVDDASSLYWNPAGLARVERRAATFMHSVYVDSSFFDYGAYAQATPVGRFGAAVQYFSAGSVTETDVAGNEVGRFTPSDLAVSFGYARTVAGFAVGAAAKVIHSTLRDSASTGALDVGVQSPTYMEGKLRWGAALANLGGTMRFDEAREKLPLILRGGVAYAMSERVLLAFDVGLPRDNDPFAAMGAEALLAGGKGGALLGRLGLNTRTLSGVDGFRAVSFGMGLRLGGLDVDYGFLPLGQIGLAHRMSLSLRF